MDPVLGKTAFFSNFILNWSMLIRVLKKQVHVWLELFMYMDILHGVLIGDAVVNGSL